MSNALRYPAPLEFGCCRYPTHRSISDVIFGAYALSDSSILETERRTKWTPPREVAVALYNPIRDVQYVEIRNGGKNAARLERPHSPLRRNNHGESADADRTLIQRYRQILNSAVETAIITVDATGHVTGWSEGARNLLGWTESEMLGQSLSIIFPHDGGGEERLQTEISDALERGLGGTEGWRLRKDGARIWAVGEMKPLDKARPEAGLVKILRDRTEHRQVETVLRERTRALEILNRAGTALARETDLNAVLQTVTHAGVAMTGAQFGAFFYNMVDASGESYMLYTISGVAREKFAQFPMPRNTAVFAPTFSGEGIIRSDDITKDPRYGHNAPHAGMPEGHLPVRSYLAVPVLSRSGGVLGGLFFGHATPGVFSESSELSLSGLAGEAAVAIDNVRLYEETQSEIAERRRAEAALRDLNANLEEQVKRRTEDLVRNAEALRQAQKMEAVGQLTGGIAHDFNNLLQVIVGNLELLTRTLPDEMPRQRRAAAMAMSGARRAAALTQKLLAFARRQPLDPKPLDINLVVRELQDLLHRSLGETVRLETALSADLWQTEVDPNELEAALLILAVNARDAMPGRGSLTIETSNEILSRSGLGASTEVSYSSRSNSAPLGTPPDFSVRMRWSPTRRTRMLAQWKREIFFAHAVFYWMDLTYMYPEKSKFTSNKPCIPRDLSMSGLLPLGEV